MRLKEDFHHSIVIERSEFICYLHKCLDEVQAKEFIQQIRRLHPEANHHCYAYIAGQHNELQRSNDAGEPSGTAGVPMLEALKLSGLQDCCAVTVRYFGGIKLGAGGLVRAYSRSVSETVKLAPKVEMVLMDRYTLTFSYDLIGKLDYLLKDQAEILTKDYGEQVVYEFLTTDPTVAEKVQELTSGRFPCQWIAQEWVEKECQVNKS